MNSKLVPLELPMMMFGKYKTSWYVNDPSGAIDPKTGKPKRIKKTKVVEHIESRGDPGFFPSVNHIYQNVKGGGRRLTKAAENLLARWRELAQRWAETVGWECTKNEKVVVEITAFFPDNQKRDTNNVYKLMMDALEGVIYDDDYWALPRTMDFHVLPKDSAKRPYFLLRIYKKSDEDATDENVA